MSDNDDENAAIARKRVGITLNGKYRLDAIVGAGGMGVVYSATHLDLERRVALKMMHASWTRKRDVRERFVREGKAANRVGHPSIVDVTDSGTAEDGTPYLVMDFLVGETLEQRVTRKVLLPVDEVLERVDELLDVLIRAHKKGIVHRDLKPENIFLTQAGELMVFDFGIARVLHEERAPARETESGQPIGTPGFMAPEQALGHHSDVDERTDLWAVGATMYRLLTGRIVHDRGKTTNQEIIVHTASSPVPTVRRRQLDTPEDVIAIVDKLLSLKPEDRYPDARALRADIASAYEKAFQKPIPRRVRPRLDSGRPPSLVPSPSTPLVANDEVDLEIASPTVLGFSLLSTRQRALALGGGAIALIVLGAVVTVIIQSASPTTTVVATTRSTAPPTPTPTPPPTVAIPAPTSSIGPDVPLMNPSSLPNAANGNEIPKPAFSVVASGAPVVTASSPPPPAAAVTTAKTGKLNVGASNGWCILFVDNQSRGATPVAGIELPTGEHALMCTTADGKTLKASVTIQPDEVTRYKFAL